MEFAAHLLNALLMIAMPLGLAIWIIRRFSLTWNLWLIGAAVFIISQVGHIPFNYLMTFLFNRTGLVNLTPTGALVFNSIYLGLSAGLWEESCRYGMYRWWVRDVRTWRKGVLLGAGHGGAEAIALGGLALYGFIQLVGLRHADLSQLVPAPQLAQAVQQVSAYWTAPWYEALLGAAERIFAMTAQIGLSILVLQVFIRRQAFWFWIAVAFHALTDGGSLLAEHYVGVYWTEALIGLFALISLGLILALRRPEAAPAEASQPAPLVTIGRRDETETAERLEETRFL